MVVLTVDLTKTDSEAEIQAIASVALMMLQALPDSDAEEVIELYQHICGFQRRDETPAPVFNIEDCESAPKDPIFGFAAKVYSETPEGAYAAVKHATQLLGDSDVSERMWLEGEVRALHDLMMKLEWRSLAAILDTELRSAIKRWQEGVKPEAEAELPRDLDVKPDSFTFDGRSYKTYSKGPAAAVTRAKKLLHRNPSPGIKAAVRDLIATLERIGARSKAKTLETLLNADQAARPEPVTVEFSAGYALAEPAIPAVTRADDDAVPFNTVPDGEVSFSTEPGPEAVLTWPQPKAATVVDVDERRVPRHTPTLSVDELRKLATKVYNHKGDGWIRDLIENKYKARKVTDVDESDLPAFQADLEQALLEPGP